MNKPCLNQTALRERQRQRDRERKREREKAKTSACGVTDSWYLASSDLTAKGLCGWNTSHPTTSKYSNHRVCYTSLYASRGNEVELPGNGAIIKAKSNRRSMSHFSYAKPTAGREKRESLIALFFSAKLGTLTAASAVSPPQEGAWGTDSVSNVRRLMATVAIHYSRGRMSCTF